MSIVTLGNKKSSLQSSASGTLSLHVLRCAVTGLYLADATSDFVVIAISPKEGRALRLDGEEGANDARRFVKALYPSFDWQAVPVSAPVERHATIYQRPAAGKIACSEHETA